MTILIDLVQLRTFVAVAEEQHLTRAAERIHVSQSAASAHVRAIEERLNTQLFVRTNRSLELTGAGQLLFRKAKELLHEATLFTTFARELRGEVEGTLSIGASGDPTASRIGDMLAALREKHPLIHLDLHTRPSSGVRQGLKSGELDVGVLLARPTDPSLVYYELRRVGFRIGGPIAWKEQIEQASWAELARLPWITPADNNMTYATLQNQMFTDRGLEVNTVANFDNAGLAQCLVRSGVGMMLMRDEYAVQGEAEGFLALSPVICDEIPLFIIHLASRKNDPLIRAFIEAARAPWPAMNVQGFSAIN